MWTPATGIYGIQNPNFSWKDNTTITVTVELATTAASPPTGLELWLFPPTDPSSSIDRTDQHPDNNLKNASPSLTQSGLTWTVSADFTVKESDIGKNYIPVAGCLGADGNEAPGFTLDDVSRPSP